MTDLPAGFVDPRDTGLVTTVLAAVVEQAGLLGVLDLVGRLPGTRVEPGSPKGFLRAAVAPSTWVGADHRLVLVDDALGQRIEDHHVVGGVTLARDALTPDRVPAVVARLIASLVAAGGSEQDASAALTACRELYLPPSA